MLSRRLCRFYTRLYAHQKPGVCPDGCNASSQLPPSPRRGSREPPGVAPSPAFSRGDSEPRSRPLGMYAPTTAASGEKTTLVFEVFPLGRVSASVQMGGARKPPQQLKGTLRFLASRPGRIESRDTRLKGALPCDYDPAAASLGCAAPADRLDLALDLPGFVSQFFYSQEIEAGRGLRNASEGALACRPLRTVRNRHLRGHRPNQGRTRCLASWAARPSN